MPGEPSRAPAGGIELHKPVQLTRLLTSLSLRQHLVHHALLVCLWVAVCVFRLFVCVWRDFRASGPRELHLDGPVHMIRTSPPSAEVQWWEREGPLQTTPIRIYKASPSALQGLTWVQVGERAHHKVQG